MYFPNLGKARELNLRSLHVVKPKCGRPDLNQVDPSLFLMYGSADLLRKYIRTYIHTFTYTHTHTHKQTNTHTHTHTYIYIYTQGVS